MEKGSPLGRHVPQPMRMASIGRPLYHKFTLEDMEEAANNFDPSNLVGEGQAERWICGACEMPAETEAFSSSSAAPHGGDVQAEALAFGEVLGHCIVPPNWNLRR
ncbi:uncharacterized protein LOC125208361 isoform X1 [Salvia hispanica]|uniref:uncharacterized protein LOC125208361 isoform X1 n=1 Tax=Salvia hispanica TaxID=49212 RepID=UPI00200930DD|nr:uncharacterized protein LOC125208361 isoform X1 [Salvia hispanica]